MPHTFYPCVIKDQKVRLSLGKRKTKKKYSKNPEKDSKPNRPTVWEKIANWKSESEIGLKRFFLKNIRQNDVFVWSKYPFFSSLSWSLSNSFFSIKTIWFFGGRGGGESARFLLYFCVRFTTLIKFSELYSKYKHLIWGENIYYVVRVFSNEVRGLKAGLLVMKITSLHDFGDKSNTHFIFIKRVKQTKVKQRTRSELEASCCPADVALPWKLPLSWIKGSLLS